MKTWRHLLLLVLAVLAGLRLPAQWNDSIRNIDLQAIEIRVEPLYAMDSLNGSGRWSPSAWNLLNTPAASPAELFGGNASVFVKQYAPGGLASISLRGTGAGHTQVYWNDVPVNSPMLGQGDFALGSAGTLGSTQLLYGGASLSEGGGGLGGAFKLKSEVRDGIQAYGEYGSFQSWRGMADAGWHGERSRAGIQVAGASAGNDFPYTQLALPGQPTLRQQHAATRHYSGTASGQHHLRGSGSQFSASVYGQFAQRQLPPTMLTTNLTEDQADFSMRGRIGWFAELPNGLGNITTGLGIVHDGLQYRNAQAGIDAASGFTRLHLRSDYLNARRRRFLRFRGAGLQLMQDAAYAEGLTSAKTRRLGSGYMALQAKRYRFAADLLLRQERSDSLWSPMLGYLGVDWVLVPRFGWSGLTRHSIGHILFNISRNYRLPTLNDLYWQPGGNPALSPEKSLASELKLYGSTALPGSAWEWTYAATAFTNHIEGWILWTPGSTGIWTPENLGRVWARGGEANLAAQCHSGKWLLHFEGSYAYTRSTNILALTPSDSSVGKQLIYTPPHNLRGILALERGDWRLSYQQGWTGRRFVSTDNLDWLPGYTTGDLGLGWRHAFGKTALPSDVVDETRRPILQVRLLASNLWNVQYQTLAWRPMPGRSISLRLQFEW